MAQKSLPILNKVNTSMIWYSTYFFKYYKWASSQYLYLLYFFNKLFVYLDFFFLILLWAKPYSTYWSYHQVTVPHHYYSRIRFFKPVTSYLINVRESYYIFNIYYKTSLEAFQSLTSTKDTNISIFNYILNTKKLTIAAYYL